MKIFTVIRSVDGKINSDFLRAFSTLEKAQDKIKHIADIQRSSYPTTLHCYIVQSENSVETTDDKTLWSIVELEVE